VTIAAGRIAPRSIELVRERADIVELVQARTGPARRVGAQWMARCPFHDERTASLSLHPQTKLYHCFGCGKSGSVFDLVMELEALSFPEAVEQLADRYGIELEREDVGPAERQAIARQRRTQALLEDAAAFYERYLASSPEAEPGRAYLAERGVAAESVTRFRLGFAPSAWERVADAARAKGYADEELYDAGLASRGQRGPIDRFRGRLIFPLQDARGVVRGFGARVLPGGEGPKYLNSPESAVFHKGRLLYGLHLARERIARGGRVIVVEGYTDVIALHAAGRTEAVMDQPLPDAPLVTFYRFLPGARAPQRADRSAEPRGQDHVVGHHAARRARHRAVVRAHVRRDGRRAGRRATPRAGASRDRAGPVARPSVPSP